MNWFSRFLEQLGEFHERVHERFWEEVEKFMTGKSSGSTQLRFYVYKDSRKQYRWRLLAKNRKIIADSGESYKEKRNCMKAISLIRSLAWNSVIDDGTK